MHTIANIKKLTSNKEKELNNIDRKITEIVLKAKNI